MLIAVVVRRSAPLLRRDLISHEFIVVAIDRTRRARGKATAFEQRETVQESPSLGDTSGAVRMRRDMMRDWSAATKSHWFRSPRSRQTNALPFPGVRAIQTLARSNNDSFTRLALGLGLQSMPEFLAVSGVAGISEFDLVAGTRGDLGGSGSLGGCDVRSHPAAAAANACRGR
jgi:hypothetical protein